MGNFFLRVNYLFLILQIFFFHNISVANESLLVIGNSITMHGPAPEIGWFGNWGMAASAKEKDYVHLLTEKLQKIDHTKINVDVLGSGQVDGIFNNTNEMNLRNVSNNYQYIVLQIGEGIDFSNSTKEIFEARYNNVVSSLSVKLKRKGTLVCLGKWWPNAPVEEVMQNVCLKNGGKFVSLKPVLSNKESLASSERKVTNSGVAAHRGDWGMKKIAESIFCAIKTKNCSF